MRKVLVEYVKTTKNTVFIVVGLSDAASLLYDPPWTRTTENMHGCFFNFI